jgi:hypothetical protein
MPFLLIAAGVLMWLVGGNLLLRRRIKTKRVFGRYWPVRVESSLGPREWLQLLALAVAALAVIAIGIFTLPS